MTSRFTSNNSKTPQGGFLATHKHDFVSHHKGEDWRHGATDIDMEPSIPACPGSTVQETLECLAAIQSSEASGTGFVSIGRTDGYSLGIYNVGAIATPTLESALNAALADNRLANGGIIMMLSGTYEVANVVTFPANVVIFGESLGTVVFDMNLPGGSPTDEIGNRVFSMPRETRNIIFQSRLATTTVHHSVRCGTPGVGTTVVENCKFKNCTLSVENGNDAPGSEELTITDCIFETDGEYVDNLKILAPVLRNTIIERCKFTGPGYAGLLGDDVGITYETAVPRGSQLKLKDCVFTLDGYTIDDSSPLTIESYLVIDESSSRISVDNCQIVVGDTLLENSAVIDAALAGTYLRHVYIRAKEMTITNSVFQGPSQNFTLIAVDYPLPVIQCVPRTWIKIDGSKFIDSFVQIGNEPGNGGAFRSTDSNVGAFITNNSFTDNIKLSTFQTQTRLDIDVDADSPASYNPTIHISGNNFDVNTSIASDSNIPQHQNVDGAQYIVHGAIQIYAKDFNVNISNNILNLDIRGFVTVGSFLHSAGVVVNNFDNDAGTVAKDIKSIIINNNHIRAINRFVTILGSESASLLYLKGTNMAVSNNHLQMIQGAASSGGFNGIAVIDNRLTLSGKAPSPANITGNTFSNQNDKGAPITLFGSWFQNETSSEGEVWIVDNVFSEPAGRDANLEVFVNQGSVHFVADRNKNQQIEILIGAFNGDVGFINTGSTTGMATTIGGGDIIHDSIIRWGQEDTLAEAVRFVYNDAGSYTFKWVIPLFQIVPHNTYIVSIDTISDLTVNASVSASADLKLRTPGSGIITDSSGALTTSGFTHNLTEVTDWAFNAAQVVSTGAIFPYIIVEAAISSVSTTSYTANNISLIYRY